MQNNHVVDAKINDNGTIDLSGSPSHDFTMVLVNQVWGTCWELKDESQRSQQIQTMFASLRGIKPQDEIEGMLAAQMIGLHNAAMECFRRSMIKEQSVDGRDMNLRQANKLTRSYATLVEALNRYRGKGQQKVTVEHVHVHAGGQAIVGAVTHSGGVGVKQKTEEQPYAKQTENAPMQEMSSQNPQREKVPVARNA